MLIICEDMNDVAEAIATVKKNIGGTDDEIRQATEEAIAFRDTFGYEVPESTRAASALIKHFGVDAKTAYDLMAKGAQNGLDYSGELIDNIDEYSVQFAKADCLQMRCSISWQPDTMQDPGIWTKSVMR